MRISDWSSRRVLFRSLACRRPVAVPAERGNLPAGTGLAAVLGLPGAIEADGMCYRRPAAGEGDDADEHDCQRGPVRGRADADGLQRSGPDSGRSEEHTSELTSLMRISYAVFCMQ